MQWVVSSLPPLSTTSNGHIPEGILSPKSYVDVPAELRKSDFLYSNFLPNYPPISVPFSIEKHPILPKLGAFYHNLLKIHPIFSIWAPSSLMKTPWSVYQILRKSTPKGRHIKRTYHVNVRTPPPQGHILKIEKHNLMGMGYNYYRRTVLGCKSWQGGRTRLPKGPLQVLL